MLHLRSATKKSAQTIGLTAAGILLLIPLTSAAAAAAPAGRAASGPAAQLPQAVGAAPRLPAGARAIGTASASAGVRFDVVLKPAHPGALRSLAISVSTPGSADYRHFLSTSKFAARFGQPMSAIRRVTATLRTEGLRPGQVSANHLMIPVTGTIKQASAALRTRFERVLLRSGRVALTNTSAPMLPGSVARITQAVLGLNTLPTARPAPPRAPGGQQRMAIKAQGVGQPSPCTSVLAAARSYDGWTYDQLAQAYSMTSLFNRGALGKQVTVALFELGEPYSTSDVADFQNCYHTTAKVTPVDVDGGATGPAGLEANLDVETVAALAPKSNILVYNSPDTSYGTNTYDLYSAIINGDRAQVLSSSYGLCEATVNTIASGLIQSEGDLFEQAAIEGISVFDAAGDSGSEACYQSNPANKSLAVQDPASQPFATSVGGTELTKLALPLTERVWNESGDSEGAGGGGISSVWDMPPWQTGDVSGDSSGTPCGTVVGYCREVPDVSASADPERPYVITFDGDWVGVGGTSAAAPLWAAMIADIDSQGALPVSVGFLSPFLYLAAPTGVVNDITVGNNDYTGTNGGLYPATPGYDMASGLGSPNAAKLAVALFDYHGLGAGVTRARH